MTNEEFQKLVLEQLSGLRNDVADIKQRQLNTEVWQKGVDAWQKGVNTWQKSMDAWRGNVDAWRENVDTWQKNMEVRQDEIYQVVKAIEHSNQIGRADMDRHEYRISRLEGKFKAAGKIFDSDEIEVASIL